MLSEGAQSGFVRRVFEAGADDLVALPEAPERVAFTFQKAVARRQSAAAASGASLSPMVCVLGPKGGTGKTLTSSNLAVTLAMGGEKVALVDLDLQFGDIGLALGLTPERTLYDLAKSGGSIDVEKLETYLTPHVSGARVLLAPTRPDQASFVSTDSRTMGHRDYDAIGNPLRQHPTVVLINHDTASAAEILASALEDHHLATIVGTRSFGKGTFQEVIHLAAGGALDLTVGQYFTANGISLANKGIKPDVRAVDDPKTPQDEALRRALAVLAEKMAVENR